MLIQMKNVSVRYSQNTIHALSNVNLTFHQGEFICILGLSGAGKSTFVRCINGLQRPTEGTVLLNAYSLTELSEEQLRKVRREIGMIFQQFHLIPRMSVYQNVLTGMFGYRSSFRNLIGWYTSEERDRAVDVIKDVGLSVQLDRRIEQLSGGQKQRVAIARALVQQPRIFIGDEPVASLDPNTAEHIFTILSEAHEHHDLLTIINVHDVEIAKRFATRIIGLRAGEIVYDGLPEQFTANVFDRVYN